MNRDEYEADIKHHIGEIIDEVSLHRAGVAESVNELIDLGDVTEIITALCEQDADRDTAIEKMLRKQMLSAMRGIAQDRIREQAICRMEMFA
jgi:hypothetical protein